MSDSMERDKTELLTVKEREEEEEMKRELLDMKMYETWYTYKDMKQILGFINESKDMANMANDEKTAQKELMQSSSVCTPEMMLKTNITQELEIQEHNDTSQSVHSYRPNHASPIHERISTHGCSNSDLASAIIESRNSVYKGKNLDSEDMFIRLQDNSNMRDSYSHSTSRYISLKSKNSLQDSDIINSTEMKMDTHPECDKKPDQWQINPLDSYVSENDVPLQEPNRPLVQDRMPFRLCKDAQTPETLEKLLPALNFYLKQTAELWHSWHRTTDTKFQWGSPIQVDVANNNLDKKLLTNIRIEQSQMEYTNKPTNERLNKRKSTKILSLSNTIHSSSDEDESITKKKKIQSHEDTNNELQSNKTICNAKCSEKNKNLKHNNVSKFINNMESEHFKMECKKESKECLSPELIHLHPKKVISQNIKRNNNRKGEHIINMSPSSLLAHSSNEKQSAINLISKEKNNSLSDEEILIELKKDNDNGNVKAIIEHSEIKPLPITGLSHRIKNECMILEKIQLEKQKKLEIEREEVQNRETNERKKREEFHKKQTDEKQKREKQKEEEEKYRKEKSKKWNTIVDMKLHKKASKENKGQFQNLNRQNKSRMSKSSPISDNSTEVLECGVCSKYKTTNGIHYEEHVNNCLQKQHKEKSLSEYSGNEINNVPNSPVRCYRPISEQTDSHIDYRRQFPTNSKITTNKHKHEIIFSATIPGGIYTDLNKAQIIPDNFIGKNDVTNRWVGNQSVIYIKNFYVNETLLNMPKVVLIFHGVDTFATIFLNAKKVGETSNMFLRYTFDVTKFIQKGENSLEVQLSSPVKVAEILYNEQASKYIIPPICNPDNYNGECHINHIRKMQASFGWDWGPAFPSMGIWKSVEIIPVNEIYITDITTDIYKGANFWNIVITVFLETGLKENDQFKTCLTSSILYINEQSTIYNSSNVNSYINDKQIKSSIILNDLVHEWWPNGYGNQTLYSLVITAATSTDIKQKTIRIGFRTVELIQKPLKQGLSFYFQINNIPIFAKGSNFIPASIFPELSAKIDTIKHLLISAKEANMNMLRVWGGGLYESELFYNMADEYGIMIWQDFMFACGMYPTTEEFLKSVKEEIIQNIRRLKNHPSIVIWAGNNENEAALYGNWYGTGTKQIYRTDYIKLYVDIIKKVVEQQDSTRPFVVSSPSNGLYTEKYNYTGKDPYLKLFGDVHYYNYIDNGWDMQQYPCVRFSSEYGFQSLPSIYTMLPVASTVTDLDIDGTFLEHRQHLPLGTLYLKVLISKNFKLPETQNKLKRFKNYIYLSQINQAVSVKIQTEFYRQSMSELNEFGEGMTMGALYWQLNDVWQAPSWSSIDFNGRWKMLHYYAVEFFAPIIVTYYIKNMELLIYIVSDKTYPMKNITLEVNLYTLDNMEPIQSHIHPNIIIEANTVTKIYDNLLKHSWIFNSTILNENQFNITIQSNCITTLTLKNETGILIAPRNYIYPSNGLKSMTLPVANVSVNMNDPLPKTACLHCIERLEAHHELMEQFLLAKRRLTTQTVDNAPTSSPPSC
ncbi:Beta-mannosidase [Eufriesea mexicana]|nr:Beta-mannosidase [Eufriesea mexicana]